LDPFGPHDDARFNDALQQAHLTELSKMKQPPSDSEEDRSDSDVLILA
jgi:hypothetical protein